MSTLLDSMLESYDKYGPVWTLTIPFRGRLVQGNTPEILEYILKTNFDNYIKGPIFYDIAHNVLGDGIFNADGEKWRKARKTASHIFNVKEFKDIINNVFHEEGLIFLEILDRAASTGEEVDLNKLFFAFTLDSFGKISFGMDFGCLRKPKSPNSFAIAFDYAQTRLQHRFTKFYWRIEEALTSERRKMNDAIKVLDNYAHDAIRVRKQLIATGKHDSKADLLDLFMAQCEEGMSDKELRDVFLNFIIAGRDTTAQALSWQFFEIATNPDIQSKIAAEVHETLKGKNAPDYDQIRSMRYANALILETERLYPSVPKNVKYVVNDDVLPGGYEIKAGNIFVFSTWTMGRSKQIWGPRARVFDPERWLSEGSLKPSPFKFPAFNAGPRVCLGQTFALLEVITLTSMIMNRYTVELVDKNFKPTYAASLTMPMAKDPMYRIHRK